MKKVLLVFLLLSFCLHMFANKTLDSLLNVLDNAIVNNDALTVSYASRIEQIRRLTDDVEKTSVKHYDLNNQLYEKYRTFVCDSAIHYLNENIEIAEELRDSTRLTESKLHLSQLLSSTGMYTEAMDILGSIDRNTVASQLMTDYYQSFCSLYSALSVYTQEKNLSAHYWDISQTYQDSLYSTLGPESPDYLRLQEKNSRHASQYDKALDINDLRLAQSEPYSPQFALVTYHRSLIYKQKGDKLNEKINLCLSAISDIRSSIRDHASLWTLAKLLYEDGDMERAYKYMRFSWDETRRYNTRLRSWQSADVLSVVDQTYQGLIETQNDRLELSIILITLLLILLLCAIGYIYCQMKKLAHARNHLQNVNTQLEELNAELKSTNACLHITNIDLSESNHIKEEYIARFIKLCSTYINRLDTYRRIVNKKITGGQISELLKMTRSQDILSMELQDLYTNFDTAFLHIFPDFVNKFNSLLQDDKHIVLKKDELLNTELRIFALIRLGINDSSQIAEFLRYSVNTIYNYRAKVKNKARGSREDFEDLVRKIH